MIVSLSATLFGGAQSGVNIDPPVASVIPKVDTVHGDIRVDDYFWLRDRTAPVVLDYLRAENEYTRSMMLDTESLQDSIYAEMLARIEETDMSVPVRRDDYCYYSRTEKGKEYPIYCRTKVSVDSAEQVLIDLNELCSGHAYIELGAYEVSPDNRYLAYSIDTTGSERYTLFFKDLQRNVMLSDHIANVDDLAAWANDNLTVYYTVLDDARRPFKLYRHKLGTDADQDRMIYHEEDDAFWLEITKTRSERFLLMVSGSHTTTEVFHADAEDPSGNFSLIRPRETDVEYYIEHRDTVFYVLTNDGAPNFKLMEVSVNDPAAGNWQEIIPHRDSVLLDGIDVFESYTVLYERERGLKKIRIIDVKGNNDYYVDFPEPTYFLGTGDNPEFGSELLRFKYSSLTTPWTVFDYHMGTRVREMKKRDKVRGGYDATLYQVERIYAPADDGVSIPISLVYRKDMMKYGENPMLLMGYGAYGWSYEPYFSSNRLSLLDRGFVYAIAHVRGGGEMGKSWHEQGQFLRKINTFTDFIACAKYLTNGGYTTSDRLVISGGSAGGLLIGAVINMEPGLFKAAVADVPFVDVINTLLDPSIPLTVVEYTELGSPFDEKFYWYMKSYSPYDNVAARRYPHMLVTAAFNDPRVGYWEPAKWTAKIRALKSDDNLLILKTNMDAGHGGSSGRYAELRDFAFEYSFMLKVLGIAP
ncbi:MAG: S9 family peptidase [candidate division WOR-3 bacterium]|nr:MAG: S9 family peptidase [candidate division WOR-3 bacterium]